MAKKEAKKSEIEVLKQRVEELGKDIDKYINKRTRRIERPIAKKYNRKYVWILVMLIIILLVVDVISMIAYYKPDLSGFFKSNNPNSSSSSNKTGIGTKCSDGTIEGSCSKIKPMFCYQGKLMKSAKMCGCPTGYKQDFQDCVKE